MFRPMTAWVRVFALSGLVHVIEVTSKTYICMISTLFVETLRIQSITTKRMD